jgi:sugar transferase (PEP-CTERM/EpsH1 system associated)
VTLPRLPNLLYVVHRVPYPPDKGDRIRSFHILRFLARRANVSLACLADEPVPEGTITALRRHCRQLAVVPLGRWSRWLRGLGAFVRGRTISEGVFQAPALTSVLRCWTRETSFDVSLASASSLVGYLRLKELGGAPAVVDLMDVDSQKWIDYAAACRGPRAWLYRTEGRRLRRLEQSLASWVRAATVVSAAEADLFRSFCPWDQIHAITNGVDLDYFHPPDPPPIEDGCVFVGALDYRPNIDAACWFCRDVWPAIHQRRPDARLRLVGRRPAPAVIGLGDVPGVDVVGQVADVRPYLTQSATAVVPLRIARGVQNKVLEALAMAKPVVASPQALVGLSDQPGLPAVSAASPKEWIDAIVDLLADQARRRQLGQAGRRYVEEHHTWERCLAPFTPLLGLTDDQTLLGDREIAASAAS